jgi:hypothetical protein
MNGALIIRWRAALAELLQKGELTEQEGIAAMREIDRLENEGMARSGVPVEIIKIVGRAA